MQPVKHVVKSHSSICCGETLVISDTYSGAMVQLSRFLYLSSTQFSLMMCQFLAFVVGLFNNATSFLVVFSKLIAALSGPLSKLTPQTV